jgi:hypothetical protein
MDESPDHKPTLIERSMGVHLNHPLAAQRGIRNPRPDRRGVWKPHPPSRGGAARARLEQDGELARSPRMGPGSGARRTATPPGVHRTREVLVARA